MGLTGVLTVAASDILVAGLWLALFVYLYAASGKPLNGERKKDR